MMHLDFRFFFLKTFFCLFYKYDILCMSDLVLAFEKLKLIL